MKSLKRDLHQNLLVIKEKVKVVSKLKNYKEKYKVGRLDISHNKKMFLKEI